jgi:hypothetical protein
MGFYPAAGDGAEAEGKNKGQGHAGKQDYRKANSGKLRGQGRFSALYHSRPLFLS